MDVYPSTLADLQKGLEGLLREPNGCFEQTSTSNYPNVLILDYLKRADQANPELEARRPRPARPRLPEADLVRVPEAGGNSEGGYEWFGGTGPPHEALTAYGLLQFRDMARVTDVDPAMLERTGAVPAGASATARAASSATPGALDSFGRAPDHITNAYIVWALTESGKDDDLDEGTGRPAEQAETSKDPYFLALVANGLLNRGRADDAAGPAQDGRPSAEGRRPPRRRQTSITGSGGRDLQIETTALAVLGWLKANRPGRVQRQRSQKAVKWIGQQRGGYGGFGSTQSTILALKALIAHTASEQEAAGSGRR